MTSSTSGNRCSACFEKIIRPSATTSKIPLVPSISSVSRPSALLISAARLEAFGRYFQRMQYVIDSFIGLVPPAPYTTTGRADPRGPSDPMPRERLLVLGADVTILPADAAVNAADATLPGGGGA